VRWKGLDACFAEMEAPSAESLRAIDHKANRNRSLVFLRANAGTSPVWKAANISGIPTHVGASEATVGGLSVGGQKQSLPTQEAWPAHCERRERSERREARWNREPVQPGIVGACGFAGTLRNMQAPARTRSGTSSPCKQS